MRYFLAMEVCVEEIAYDWCLKNNREWGGGRGQEGKYKQNTFELVWYHHDHGGVERMHVAEPSGRSFCNT